MDVVLLEFIGSIGMVAPKRVRVRGIPLFRHRGGLGRRGGFAEFGNRERSLNFRPAFIIQHENVPLQQQHHHYSSHPD